jgi:ankyrin repeat protein
MNQTSCGSRQFAEVQQVRDTNVAISLQTTKQNRGKRCEARLYDSGELDDEFAGNCYKLQEKLQKAIQEKNITEVKDALRYGANPNATFYNSLPPLQVAAMVGNLEAAHLLLDNGADVNKLVDMGNTALKFAVYQEHADVVKLLIQNGANVCDKRQSEETALQMAQKKGNKEIENLLKDAGATRCWMSLF